MSRSTNEGRGDSGIRGTLGPPTAKAPIIASLIRVPCHLRRVVRYAVQHPSVGRGPEGREEQSTRVRRGRRRARRRGEGSRHLSPPPPPHPPPLSLSGGRAGGRAIRPWIPHAEVSAPRPLLPPRFPLLLLRRDRWFVPSVSARGGGADWAAAERDSPSASPTRRGSMALSVLRPPRSRRCPRIRDSSCMRGAWRFPRSKLLVEVLGLL
jgi:hypothetical protein